jgi:hypothetical protein
MGDDLDVEHATDRSQRQGTLSSRQGTVMLAHDRKMEAETASEPAEPLGIAQLLSQRFGSTQVVEDTRLFVEWHQDITQFKPQVDGLL